jgi:hypothetical protein
MAAERERRIRERAYAIWEREGRPHGKDLEHWRRAEAEIAAGERPPGATGDDGAVAAAEPDAGSTVTLSHGGRGRRRHRIDSGAAASSGGRHVGGPRGGKPKPPRS